MSVLPFRRRPKYGLNSELRTNHLALPRSISVLLDIVSFKIITGMEPVFTLDRYPIGVPRRGSAYLVCCLLLTSLRSYHYCTMGDPLNLATGLSCRLLLEPWPTVTALSPQRQAIRNLRPQLDKAIQRTASMQRVLSAMLGNPKGKPVKKMGNKCFVYGRFVLTVALC